MRALLVVNPKATATTARGRDVLARALGSDLKSTSPRPSARGHATELGRPGAADEGSTSSSRSAATAPSTRSSTACSRDGPGRDGAGARRRPRRQHQVFAPRPGHARATRSRRPAACSTRCGTDRSRRIGLGRADGRTTGALVHLHRRASGSTPRWCGGRAAGPRASRRRRAATPRATLRRFFFGTDRRHGALTLERPGEEPVEGLFLGIVGNTTPVDLLRQPGRSRSPRRRASRPGWTSSRCASWASPGTLWAASRRCSTGRGVRGRSAHLAARPARVPLVADRPLPFEVDGDYLGEREDVHFTSVPSAIRVIC